MHWFKHPSPFFFLSPPLPSALKRLVTTGAGQERFAGVILAALNQELHIAHPELRESLQQSVAHKNCFSAR